MNKKTKTNKQKKAIKKGLKKAAKKSIKKVIKKKTKQITKKRIGKIVLQNKDLQQRMDEADKEIIVNGSFTMSSRYDNDKNYLDELEEKIDIKKKSILDDDEEEDDEDKKRIDDSYDFSDNRDEDENEEYNAF